MTTPNHDRLGQRDLDAQEEIAVPVVEEELTATTRGVERGSVRVETNVTERDETLSVPVTEERVHVERHAVDRPASSSDISADGAVIDVPVHGEEVELQKQARVVEEVEISKEAVQQTEQVSGTVRREDVEVVEETPIDRGAGSTRVSGGETRR